MPRTRSLAWSELKIGLITIVALVLAGTLIFLLSGESGFFWQRYSLKTVFPNIAGLKEGAPVRVAGVEVGSVSNIKFLGDQVEVTMEVKEENRPRITTDSRATLGAVSLLGESAVDITSSSKGTPVPDWGYVPAGKAAGSIAEVATQANEGLQEATALLRDIRSGRGTVGRFVTDEAVYEDLQRFINSAEQVTNAINRGRGTLGRLNNDPRLYEELHASVANLNEVTSRIRSGEGSLGRLLNDPALANSLTSTSKNLEGITERLNRGEGTAGRFMTDTAVYDRFNSVAQRLDTLTTRLNEGEGTAGQLLRDKQLYENMNQAVGELRGLLAEIRKDPKKYLNVKVSIF
ncbi:MAG TPA: MlaD family protein [Vicinamibacterales bacterium]|nr:MlaD family protein [Vicinamibacterales bacterium]